MKRIPIPQFEFPFARDCFNLITETTQDGTRIMREQEQLKKDKAEAEKRQTLIHCSKDQ